MSKSPLPGTSDPTPPGSLTPDDLQAKLASLNAEVTAELEAKQAAAPPVKKEVARAAPKPRRAPAGWLALGASIAALIVLPFLVLIGGAVWLYRAHAIPTWLALACSGVVAGALLTLYGARISKKLTGKARVRFIGTKLALPAVIFYCGSPPRKCSAST